MAQASSTITLALLLMITLTAGYHTGAPTSRCDSMTPGHIIGSQTSEPPYTVMPDRSSYTANDIIIVTIQANNGVTFKGFMLQARDQSGASVGEFTTVDTATKLTECSGAAAVTHDDGSRKTIKSFTWKAPAEPGTGAVTFFATIVQRFTTYWVKVPSPAIAETTATEIRIIPQSDRVQNNDEEKTTGSPPSVVSNNRSILRNLWEKFFG
ncbi:PREDICTED: putative defense protein 3 [Priapulus caudatus]|uniref:Defense protein 3 n=1 Tax=Priapulus caudatus TaxID=37621 RepID=A0ABM1EE24_PRICU|nr:PREDICTED: putative defense protein 3 [Priapulus caudatus]